MALSSKQSFDALRINTDDVFSVTSVEQSAVECSVEKVYTACLGKTRFREIFPLNRSRHLNYLRKGLKQLSEHFECLDASRPWLCYWILHSLNLLGESLSEEEQLAISDFLKSVQHGEGGFCGNVGHLPHLATTYAAISSVFSLDYEACYNVVNRTTLENFLKSMHKDNGSFTMHRDGEVDVRGAYCAAVVATLCGLKSNELFHNTPEWIASCQTYEGGFGSRPGTEAHGGYTYCSLAALILLGRTDLIDKKKLLYWAVHRQMKFEGGFQGRTNKLVDGCYSFWQGGIFPLIHHIMDEKEALLDLNEWLFSQVSLQEYILYCCQYPAGGLVDKPGKSRDFYHSCYCLSGLSVAQHSPKKFVVGDSDNLLERTHPVFNIVIEKVERALSWASKNLHKETIIERDNNNVC